MAQIHTGTVKDVNVKIGFLIAEMQDGTTVLCHRLQQSAVSDSLTIIPIERDDAPVLGDQIYLTLTEGKNGPKARWWTTAEDYLRPIWSSKPHMMRLCEALDGNPSPTILWEGERPQDALRHLHSRRWRRQPEVDRVRSVTLESGLVVHGWWEQQSWNGEWTKVPDPFHLTAVPAPEAGQLVQAV